MTQLQQSHIHEQVQAKKGIVENDVTRAMKTPNHALRSGRERSGLPGVSVSDALIIRELLNSKGKISSLLVARKADLPLTSVQRHRKRIEEGMIKTTHMPIFSVFGIREVGVDVKTERGLSARVAAELRDFPNVIYLARVHGDCDSSLRIRILVRTNLELGDWIERIKGIEGVRDVFWSETIEEISCNPDMMTLLNLSKILEHATTKEQSYL